MNDSKLMHAGTLGACAVRPGLFRSASWLRAWDQVWPSDVPERPIYSGHSSNLIQYPINLAKLLRFQSAAPKAISTPCLEGFASEYLCFNSPADFSLFLQEAESGQWDQLYLRGLLDKDFEVDLLKQYCLTRGYLLMRREDMPAYGINTANATFDDYCAGLGKSTRDRVLGGRRRLQKRGELHRRNLWPDIDHFLKILNQFHEVRWGKPCIVGESEQFIRLFLTHLQQEGGCVDLSALMLDDKCVSVMLDVELDGWVYNLQSGFSEQDFGRVSLGMVHFGMQIEQSFSLSRCHYYDFMAGDGKSANYKASIANNTLSMGDYYVVRSVGLKLAYQLNDCLKRNKNITRFPE